MDISGAQVPMSPRSEQNQPCDMAANVEGLPRRGGRDEKADAGGAASRHTGGRDEHEEASASIRGLMAGANWRGVQQSGRANYDVEVQIQSVDIDNAFVCGYLKISGLTDEFPELTTYFEGEILGDRHTFLTKKWDADETTDREVWCSLPAPVRRQGVSQARGAQMSGGADPRCVRVLTGRSD